jgi:hypothetical protein
VADQDNAGLRATETYIAESFPIRREQITHQHADLESIDLMCQGFCDSRPVYTSHVLNRRMFITQNGLLGLGPRVLATDDMLCFVYGCGVPLILRPTQGDQYRIVGEAYVHSIMDGEFLPGHNLYNEISVTIV